MYCNSLEIYALSQDFYKAAVIRNPVIDIAVMWGVSDIPDWCCVEGGVTYDPATPPSSEDMGKMHSMSPIMHVKKVRMAGHVTIV